MCKCEAITDSLPCGQEQAAFYDKSSKTFLYTGLCYYHEKMRQGLLQPYREHECIVKWNGETLNKR